MRNGDENMPRAGLTKEKVIEKAAGLANEKGLSSVTVTSLSEYLGIKKPSLYYHVSSQEEVIEGLMIYGWKKVSEEIVVKAADTDAHESLRKYAREFYRFALANPGVFEAMLWYNKYVNEELSKATEGLYNFFFEQTDKLGIQKDTANHLLRTYRAFLEGFIMLDIHHSFGNPISISESFDLSLDVLLKGMEQYEGSNK